MWVAEGTYYPDEGGGRTDNDRAKNFFIVYDGVQLYGGFAGTETLRSQRDWAVQLTVLSGDSDGDGTSANNAYHVVYLDGVTNDSITAATVLDGFTVSGGNASGRDSQNYGGGFYCAGSGAGRECRSLLASSPSSPQPHPTQTPSKSTYRS